MLDLGYLDVVIGLFLIYLVLALAVTVLNELVAQVTRLRANTLQDGLVQLFDSTKDERNGFAAVARVLTFRALFPDAGPTTKRLLASPAIRALGNHPSYIPSPMLARALIEELRRTPPADMGGSRLAETLGDALGLAQANAEAFAADVAEVFDATMDRVSGWYKRRIQAITLVFAVVLVSLLNADTLKLFDHLQTDSAAREALVAQAGSIAGTEGGEVPQFGEVSDAIEQSKFSFGWISNDEAVEDSREFPADVGDWALKVLGLVVTALAVSLGAPFWFDALGRLVRVRSAGKATDKPDRP